MLNNMQLSLLVMGLLWCLQAQAVAKPGWCTSKRPPHPLLALHSPRCVHTYRVVTSRIVLLVKHRKVDSKSIISVSFTNKAAKEMYGTLLACSSCRWNSQQPVTAPHRKTRVVQELGPVASAGVTICTFHALCANLLRKYVCLQ